MVKETKKLPKSQLYSARNKGKIFDGEMTQELEQKNLRNSHVVKIAQMNANENISAFRPSGTKSNANSSMIYETMSINPSYAGI